MTGRNTPCPCGSGKKYKKCCLDKDQAEKRAEREAQNLLSMASKDCRNEDDSLNDDPYMDELFFRFEAADFEEQLVMFHEVINQQLGDENDLFDLFSLLQQSADDDLSRRKVNESLVELRQQRFDCWKKDMGFYIHSFLLNSLVTGDIDNIRDYFLEVSKQPEQCIDIYCNCIDMLAYYGRQQELTEGLRLALPCVSKATGLMPWVADDIASRLIDYEILTWAETHSTEDLTALQQVVEKIQPKIESTTLCTYAEHLTGRLKFSNEIQRDAKNRLDLEQISFLTATFASYLSRECGMSGITSLSAGREVYHYIARRETGELKASRRLTLMFKVKGIKRKAPAPHPLIPDPETLERFFANQLHLLSQADYAVALLAQCLPAWLDFLQEQNILESSDVEERLQLLLPLIKTLIEIFDNRRDIPNLATNLRQAWGDFI